MLVWLADVQWFVVEDLWLTRPFPFSLLTILLRTSKRSLNYERIFCPRTQLQ
jgi:hypothetical protein